MKNLNKIELLEEMYEMEAHNWICYSKDLSLTEAKKGFSKEWEKSKKKNRFITRNDRLTKK